MGDGKPGLIHRAWESYLRAVIPSSAPLVQITECKRAFYAGANGMFSELLRAVSPGQEVEDADLQMMADVQREFDTFAEDVKAGRA